MLRRAIAQRIHLDADRQSGQRIVIFRAREHRPLIAQPPDIADKHQHQQSSGAYGNPDLCAGEGHFIEFMEVLKTRKDYRWKTRTYMYEWGFRNADKKHTPPGACCPRRNDKFDRSTRD